MVEYATVEMVYLIKRKDKVTNTGSLLVYNHMLNLRKAKMNEQEKKEFEKMSADVNYVLKTYYCE